MSLRTRRSGSLAVTLLMLLVACQPAGPTTPTSGGVATPGGAGTPRAATPAAPGTPSGGTPAGGSPSATQTAGGSPSATGTSAAGGSQQPAGQGGTLRVYCCATDFRSLRPQAASGSDEISILSATQRGLLYYDPGNPDSLTLVPALADGMPEISDDGLTYTFKLGDHNYSDGTKIVAEDFVRGARALADPRNAFDYGYEMCWVAGVDDVLGNDFGCSTETRAPYNDVDACDADPTDTEACGFDAAKVDELLGKIGVTAPDDSTVVFNLKVPTSFWSNIVAMWLLTPVHPDQTSWAEAADMKATGPFMMESWAHNQQVVLVPNPEWNGEKPKVDRIEVAIGGDPAAAVAAFERGDLDLVTPPSSERRRVLDTPELADISTRRTTLSIEYYDFANCPDKDTCPPNEAVGNEARLPGMSPTQNKEFRIALSQAIDKTELIQVGFAGFGVVASTPTMPGIPEFPTNHDPYPFDVASARAHMETALNELGVPQPDPATVTAPDCTGVVSVETGKTPGDYPECVARARVRSLGPLRFGFNCDAGHDQRVLYLANAWRTNLGFAPMDIRCTDFATIRTERRSGKVYDIVRNGWGADFPHPDNQNRDLFACGAGNNNSKYCNPDYDDKLNEAAQSADYASSVPLYKEAETMLADDAPVIFLAYGETLRLIRPWVTGMSQTAQDSQNAGDRFPEMYAISPH